MPQRNQDLLKLHNILGFDTDLVPDLVFDFKYILEKFHHHLIKSIF